MLLSIGPVWRGLAGFVLGAIIGSFLATIATRWPENQDVVRGRSRCESCGRTLKLPDLIPLASFLASRGKCRKCDAAIDPVHFIIEVLAGAIAALALVAVPGPTGLAGAIFGWFLLTLAVLDIRHFWLPDRLTLPLIGLGLAFAAMFEMPRLIDAFIGAVAGFLLLVTINYAYRALRGRDGLGGGDSKLLAAIGAWLGWQMLPLVLLLASGAGIALILLLRLSGNTVPATRRLPFGLFLAMAAGVIWFWINAFDGDYLMAG